MSITAEQVKAYQAEHECGVQEAKRALEKQELLCDIQRLSIYECDSAVRDILAKMVERYG